jgi:hypothetical protein
MIAPTLVNQSRNMYFVILVEYFFQGINLEMIEKKDERKRSRRKKQWDFGWVLSCYEAEERTVKGFFFSFLCSLQNKPAVDAWIGIGDWMRYAELFEL